MMNNNNNWFLSVLTLIFVTLKLTDNIDWSWWWVLSPIWGGIVLVIVVSAGLYTYYTMKGR